MKTRQLLFGLLLLASPVWAANYTVNTNTIEDQYLGLFATANNGTNQQGAQNMFISNLHGWADSYIQSKVNMNYIQWHQLSAGARAQVCTDLAVSPCPP